MRRLSRMVLVTGTVLALLAALGPLWAARAGVVVAVIAAVVACMVTWRELAEARRSHSHEMLSASRAAGAALTAERRHNASVVDTLTTRAVRSAAAAAQLRSAVFDLSSTVEALQKTVAGLRREVEVLRGQHVADREQIEQRDESLALLHERLSSRESELRALLESEAHVRALPRRVLTDHGSQTLAASEGLRRSGTAAVEAPHVDASEVDPLSRDRTPEVSELVQVAVMLPNYEGERKRA